MAEYKKQSDPDLIEDLHERKEFAQLWVPPTSNGTHDFREGNVSTEGDAHDGVTNILTSMEPQTHQQFVHNFMNPNTPNMRMHLMHSTGCHAPGTLIRVHGSAVPQVVEKLTIGDCLVHPDGGKTMISELHCGYSFMYRIIPKVECIPICSNTNGTPTAFQSARVRKNYDVNADHILHLYSADGIVNVPVITYVAIRSMQCDAVLSKCDHFLAYKENDGTISKVKFTIVPIGMGYYYGFTLTRDKSECANVSADGSDDDDALFLGADGLILHNSGKCLGRGTPIQTKTRGIIMVENMTANDILVGDDDKDRHVAGLARGIDIICYRVSPRARHRFDSFVCNSAHILTLYDRELHTVVDRAIEDVIRDETQCNHVPMNAPIALHRYQILRKIKDSQKWERCAFAIENVGCREYFGFTLDGNGRFLLGDGTVTHNTRAAILVAQDCVKTYRYIYRNVNWRDASVIAPSIFIIAFGGKHAFIRDLIKYPEFGYATSQEYETFMRLYRESTESEEAHKKYQEFFSVLKRRATNRSKGGFYKMLGYDEFANRLFGADVIKLGALIQEAHSNKEPHCVALERAIARGDIKPDPTLMARLENSLLIADEIHNTYNSQTINNRGLALQYVLDHVRGLRFLSLSATPINSDPAEICDFTNYFVAQKDKLMREEIFSGRNLRPRAIDRINELLRGHISFLYDFDPNYFPKRIDHGTAITVRAESTSRDSNGSSFRKLNNVATPAAPIKSLPYLKFIPCMMSDFFVNTIRAFYRIASESDHAARSPELGDPISPPDAKSSKARTEAPVEPEPEHEAAIDIDDDIIGIPQSSYSLFDMVFPNPDSADIGLYNSANLFGSIHNASAAWKTQNGIALKTTSGTLRTFSGSFLQSENLMKYSAKYANMISVVTQAIRDTGPCKIMIYHERVRMTGVIMICEILRENGFVDEYDVPTDRTLCAICTKSKSEHSDAPGSSPGSAHQFRPLRFVALYSELGKSAITSIREKYNSMANMHGEWCSVLVGSKLIRESYDFLAVRHLLVLSLPISISQLIQVFGRCVRRGSHTRLPENERNVHIYVLVNASKMNGSPPSIVEDLNDTPEIRRYALKLSSYIIVQKIEREMARNAIDAGINHNIITRPEQDSLGFLLYDEAIRFTMPEHGLKVDTFFAYGYGMQEIQFAIDIIKRLFRQQSVWNALELVTAVRNPPFGVWMNPSMILDSSIAIALAFLISATGNTSIASRSSSIDDRAIVIGGSPHLIVASSFANEREGAAMSLDAGDYFFLAPIETIEVAGIAKSRTLIDIESFIRGAQYDTEDVIPIDQFEMRSSFDDVILVALRAEFKTVSAIAAPARAKNGIAPNIMAQMKQFLVRFSVDQQRTVIRRFIEDPDMRDEFAVLHNFLTSLGVFIPYHYVNKYREIARRFDPNFVAAIKRQDIPVAFGDGASIRIYTGSEWISVGRSALNMHVEFNENGALVGIYKQFPYVVKFQLRDPIQKLRHDRGSHRHDSRTIERGSVCMTKSRAAIEHCAQKLGIPVRDIRTTATANKLCDIIQDELLRKEIGARSDPHSLIKYVYGWWDTILTPF